MTKEFFYNDDDRILIAHGGGGRLSNQLIEEVFFNEFKNSYLQQSHDGAIIQLDSSKIAVSTDSFVVHPVFFPGGNIGELAVNGTINDLVCCGAKPLYLSLSFIIEEGFLIKELHEIVKSIATAAKTAGVEIVTGDTKVVDKGKGDKIYINTTGIGEIYSDLAISPKNIKPGDAIIINGTIADHGISIISKREGLEFETPIKSDTAALNSLFEPIFERYKNIHVLRDPTRGGLASTLNEIAKSANLGITLFENAIPLRDEVFGACEILGFDPLYVANEGKILIILPEEIAGDVLKIMRNHPLGKEGAIIGKVNEENKGVVKLKTIIGSTRIVDMISGEQLPRIC